MEYDTSFRLIRRPPIPTNHRQQFRCNESNSLTQPKCHRHCRAMHIHSRQRLGDSTSQRCGNRPHLFIPNRGHRTRQPLESTQHSTLHRRPVSKYSITTTNFFIVKMALQHPCNAIAFYLQNVHFVFKNVYISFSGRYKDTKFYVTRKKIFFCRKTMRESFQELFFLKFSACSRISLKTSSLTKGG